MNRYHGPHTDMWDGWLVPGPQGKLHLFHLQMPIPGESLSDREANAVGHAVSEDGLHWEWVGPVLPPLWDEANPMDFHPKYTGCAVEKDGRCYLFYTMRDREAANQRIGVALSDDWVTFTPWEGNPVLCPDDSLLLGYDSVKNHEWGIVDCRDMLILFDEDSRRYLGYFAAAADVGRPHSVGVIAMAESDDLLHWDSQRIVYTPRQNGMIEVPDVFCMDGKWFLTFLAGPSYAGRSLALDDTVKNGTFYAVADSPRGPFREGADNLLIGGKSQSGFSCRSVLLNGNRMLYYTDRTPYGCRYALPKALRLNGDGNLRACYSSLLENLRQRELPQTAELTLLPNSFAWKTYGGAVARTAGGFRVTTTEWDYQVAAAKTEAAALELRAAVTVDAVGGGFYFSDGTHRYLLSLEPGEERLLLAALYDFSPVTARRYPFLRHSTYDLRILLMDGTLEVYVQEELLLQGGVELDAVTEWGVFADRGETLMEEIELYELE